MTHASDPPPPVVTIRGGPPPTDPSPDGRQRPLLLALLLGLAVLAGVVAVVREPAPAPDPDCGALCRAGDPVVIGAALPLTGVLAPFGAAQQRGAQQVVEQVNADGGWEIAGRRRALELLVRDTGSQPDVAGQQALQLVRGPFDVVVLLGPCAPPVAMVRVAESRGVPLVTGCQPLPPVGTAALQSTWEVAPAEADRAAAVFAGLRAARGRRVALFLSNDRPGDTYTQAADQSGFEVVGTYRPHGADWAAAVSEAAGQRADLVVAITQAPEGIALWRELTAQGVRPELAYASEAASGSAWYRAVGPAAEGTLTDAVHPLPAGARRGRARPGPGGADDAVAAVSGDLTRVLLDGLQKASSATRDGVNAGLAQATGSVDGTPVRFTADHASRVPHRLARWQDGELVPVPVGR